MNITIEEDIQGMIRELGKLQANLLFAQTKLLPLASRLSESSSSNLYGNELWLMAYNREDLEIFMTLAPRWDKSTEGKIMKYSASVSGVKIVIRATDEALPPTCHVIKETLTEEARPARTYEVERIVCEPSSTT